MIASIWGVDGLVQQQRLGHQVQLVDVLGQDLLVRE
jgi:hypothetical protein